MKKLLVTFLLIILSFVTYSQSGVGYVNYTSYKTHNGTGVTNQYLQFPNTAAEFNNILNTANSNTTITHTGEVTLATMCDGSTGTPHWAADFYAIKFEFWFIPTETGTYRFGVNSDDASDLSVDGTIITTYYGGHGASGYQYGSTNMVAGTLYKIVVRYQEYGGGDALFVNWSRPSAPNSYSYWNEEVTNKPNNPTKKALLNFYLNQNLNATTFAVGSALSSSGSINITNLLDSNKVATGNKAIIAVSNWESVIINPYEANIGGHRLMLDERMFGSTSPSFNSINSIKVLDIYDGQVSVYDTTGWWKTYLIPTNVANKITTSQYQSSLRLQDGWYAIQAGTNISYTSTTSYKTQSITLTTTNNLSQMYTNIVTVSDVYLAFKELANGGIFGNQSGNEFVYGIQYKNADVNEDGVFNEADCFTLLQNLTGAKILVDTFNLNKTMRIIPQSTYDIIGKSNWNTITTPLGSVYEFGINTGKSTDTINLAVVWKGDVNLSHSTTPKSNNVTTTSVKPYGISTMSISNEINASILTEVIDDSIYAYITLEPLTQSIVGTQFQLNYDNSVLKFNGVKFITNGSPTNYASDRGDYINLGSLVSDGSTSLDKMTTYKISFSSNTKLDNILGLISIGSTDAVNKNGTQLKVKIN
jgi:hypothetical protein